MCYLNPYCSNSMTYYPYQNQFDDITFTQEEENCNRRINQIVNRILGKTMPNDVKEQLIEQITFIFHEYEREILESFENNYSQSINSNSDINIIFFPISQANMMNTGYMQTINQSRLTNPYIFNNISHNPYNFNFTFNQMQLFQPNLLSYNQPMTKNSTKKSHKKNSKKTAKKDSKKSEKKPKNKKSKELKSQESENVVVKKYVEGHELEGLIDYLNKKCDGNAHLKGLIFISSNGDKNNHCYDLIDRQFTKNFYPKDSPDSFVMFDFKEKKISVTHYSIGHRLNSLNKLLNWELLGSNDGKNWNVLDERHIKPWNGTNNVSTYSTDNHDFYRFVKLKLKGESSSNKYCMILASVEFFGKLNNCQ